LEQDDSRHLWMIVPRGAAAAPALPREQHTVQARQALRRWIVGLVLATTVLGSATIAWHARSSAEAACPSYVIRWGDTLARIAERYHTTISALARLNGIRNVNLIYAGQTICVGTGAVTAATSDPLEWSTPAEVRALLLRAADQHRLPRDLVLAIAWQESRWTQHVIAWDGGVGTMQLMPYTTAWLNNYLGTQYDAYRLKDNIQLGTMYLSMLWREFPGQLDKVISGYNEGARNVTTHGIFNWAYVHAVLYWMRLFG
jgi:soluble lytic murein transglycosylase-like protein